MPVLCKHAFPKSFVRVKYAFYLRVIIASILLNDSYYIHYLYILCMFNHLCGRFYGKFQIPFLCRCLKVLK